MTVPKVPVDPILPIRPIGGYESSAPNVQGPRIPGKDSPKLTAKDITGTEPPQDGRDFLKRELVRVLVEPVGPEQPDAIKESMGESPHDYEWTPTRWAKKQVDSLLQFATGIVSALKVSVSEGAYILRNMKWLGTILFDHPDILGRELEKQKSLILKSLGDQIVHTWGKGGLHAFTHNTFEATLDLLGALGFGSSVLGKTSKALAALGATKSATKLANLATALRQVPMELAKQPFKGAYIAANRVPGVAKMFRKLGLDPAGMEAKNELGAIGQDIYVKHAQLARENLKIGLTGAEKKELDDIVIGIKRLDEASSPKVAERARWWLNRTAEDERWLRETGLMSEEALEAARYKPLAIELKRRGIYQGELLHKVKGETVFRQEAIDFARNWAERASTKPVYMPFLTEKSLDFGELIEALTAPDKRKSFLNYVSRLERKTGLGKGAIWDPDRWQTRSILQMGRLRASVAMIEHVANKYGRITKTGIASPGYVLFPAGIYTRYIKHGLIPVLSKLYNEAIRAVLKAPDEAKAEAFVDAIRATHSSVHPMDSYKALLEAMKDPNVFKLEIPEGVHFVLSKTVLGPSTVLKALHRPLDVWRDFVLTLMPRYYVNNLLGNSILLMFGGYHPGLKTAVLRGDDLPGEVLNSYGVLGATEGVRPSQMLPEKLQRGLTRLQEYTDIEPRQILLNAIGPEVIRNEAAIGNTVASALVAKHGVEETLRIVFRARKKLLGVAEEIGRRGRQLAASPEQMEYFAAALQGGRPHHLTPRQENLKTNLLREIMSLQRKIKSEKALANLIKEVRQIGMETPEAFQAILERHPGALEAHSRIPLSKTAVAQRIADLRKQMQMKIRKLNALDPRMPLITESLMEKAPDVVEIAKLIRLEEELRPLAAIAERGVREMEKFLGNYGRLHPVEARYVRAVIPFWTFARTMNMLVFQLPFIRPRLSFLWNHYAKLLWDMTDDQNLPWRLRRNYVAVGTDKDGNPIMARIAGFNPFEAVGLSEFGGLQIPRFTDPSQHPVIKLVIESKGGFDTFFERPFTNPTEFVGIDGSVWLYDPDTKRVERIIPQKPLVRSLMQQIPHVRVVQEILDGLGGPLRDVAGITPRNPDGTYLVDRSPWWAAARALGFPISAVDPERIKKQHRIIVEQMIRRWRGLIRRTDPETRRQVEHLLNDLQTGGWEVKD